MSTKQRQGRSKSNYDEATVHLLSAFFCITGSKPEDRRLRTAIEAVLVNINKAELAVARSNIVQFCRSEVRARH